MDQDTKRKQHLSLLEIAANASRIASKAREQYGDYASLHEAYAVLLEEVDELFQLVKMKRGANGPTLDVRISDEALDIAAVALRIANLELDTER